jgi:hypothetical protein
LRLLVYLQLQASKHPWQLKLQPGRSSAMPDKLRPISCDGHSLPRPRPTAGRMLEGEIVEPVLPDEVNVKSQTVRLRWRLAATC